VIGRLGNEARFCIQGTCPGPPRRSAGIEVLDSRGRRIWRDERGAPDLDYDVGAYVHWISEPDIAEPAIIYSFVPASDRHRGGARLARARDGSLLKEIENTGRFGNNNSIVADLGGDGHLEGVGLTNTRDGGSDGRREIRCVDLATGEVKWRTAIARAYLDTYSPLMADFDGNGRLCAVVGTGNPAGYARLPGSEPWGDLYVVDHAGGIAHHESLPGWPVNLAFCDVDDDGRGELTVVLDGTPGSLAVYETQARTPRRDWPTPFGNAARAGTMPVRSG
jgi:hypothetical protein